MTFVLARSIIVGSIMFMSLMQNGLQHHGSWVSVHTKQKYRKGVRPGCGMKNLRKISASLTLYQKESDHHMHNPLRATLSFWLFRWDSHRIWVQVTTKRNQEQIRCLNQKMMCQCQLWLRQPWFAVTPSSWSVDFVTLKKSLKHCSCQNQNLADLKHGIFAWC